MLWDVEVSSLGQAPKGSLRVEADSWQKALQIAREQRGEATAMDGFSIELVEDGCRAIDPASRLRYAVRKLKDNGAPLPPRPSSRPPPPGASPIVSPAAAAPPIASPAAAPATSASSSGRDWAQRL